MKQQRWPAAWRSSSDVSLLSPTIVTSVFIVPSIPSELTAATRTTSLRLLRRHRPGPGPLAKSGFGVSAASRGPTVKRWSVGTARQLAVVCATVATRMACPQTVGAAAIAAAAELRSSASPKTRAATLDAPSLPAATLLSLLLIGSYWNPSRETRRMTIPRLWRFFHGSLDSVKRLSSPKTRAATLDAPILPAARLLSLLLIGSYWNPSRETKRITIPRLWRFFHGSLDSVTSGLRFEKQKATSGHGAKG